MAILVLPLSFISIFLCLGVHAQVETKTRDLLLKSVLVFAALIVVATELLSLPKQINAVTIFIFWLIVSLICLTILFRKKAALTAFIASQFEKFRKHLKSLNVIERLLLISVTLLLILIFIQGLLYPPNNWDSMTYHLARILHWTSNQSVSHFPTHIFRQVYQPPFSEFAIMHFNLLSTGDYFSNSVQFFFLVSSLIAVSSLGAVAGMARKYQVLSIFLAATLPEVILQGSSTQNDVVQSFFILCSVYYAVRSAKDVNRTDFLYFGLSIGLAVLTKATSYLLLTPLIAIFAVSLLIRLYKRREFAVIGFAFFSVLVFFSINAGHYFRNYQLSENILGLDKSESAIYANEKMTPFLFFSNVIKNAGLQVAPFPVNKWTDAAIRKVHILAGININNPETNYMNEFYKGSIDSYSEDWAPNPLHFMLILITIGIIGFRLGKGNFRFDTINIYAILMFSQVILFCWYLKWQPWHTRLHTPIFLLAIPLLCLVFSLNDRYYKWIQMATALFIVYAVTVVLVNTSRPYLHNSNSVVSLNDHRYKKFFANRFYLYEEYAVIHQKLSAMNNAHIGLVLHYDDWEYPLFYRLQQRKIKPVHIGVANITKNCSSVIPEIKTIISTTENKDEIEFDGKMFQNQSGNNKWVWFYNRK